FCPTEDRRQKRRRSIAALQKRSARRCGPPDEDGPRKELGMDRREAAAVGLLGLVSLALFLSARDAPLLEPAEGRYAEIPREMLAAGEGVVPLLHGQPYLDKPPLLYWLVMAAYSLGGVADGVARVVPGLVGVLTVLAAWLWGRLVLDRRSALAGA